MVPLKKWNFLASLAVIGTEEGLHHMLLLHLFSYYYRRCDVTQNCSEQQYIQFQPVTTPHTLSVSPHYSN
jgi:hypothetical protein